MRFVLSLLLLALLYKAHADELSDCKCWEGYKATKTNEGVRCQGILLLHAMDCNVPERPKCVCTGNVTGILTDSSGTWCSEYANGKEQRKWECENKAEWDKFYQSYPKEKPE
ncbi:uncharacterized protein LOC108905487 [Anoplophora glabripennis]|uniref:uncharacterized protein LOC108905487 n=1 Tax=Anoplophora glabripennis TaxID=217634 RepID=UPI000874490C|nr:uncharacterized protein LOC108905487 [Anoplophora glabripennis]XP_018563877.1 uncharacterized protein LOC108905487 [Anoplophora glabripennis]